MISNTKQRSAFRDALRLYDFNRYKILVYLVVLTLGTGVALLLDIGFGVRQERVLLYLAPVMVFFFLATTAACVAARRYAVSTSGQLARNTNSLLQAEFNVRHAIPSDSLTGSMSELRELRNQAIDEILQMIHEAVAEEIKITKRTFHHRSITVRARFSTRTVNSSRR